MKVLYFAWMRQRVGAGEETHNPPANVDTVAALIDWLRAKGPNYEAAFQDPRAIKVAVNQTFASLSTESTPQDEVAFFPPVTGG